MRTNLGDLTIGSYAIVRTGSGIYYARLENISTKSDMTRAVFIVRQTFIGVQPVPATLVVNYIDFSASGLTILWKGAYSLDATDIKELLLQLNFPELII